MFTNLPEEKHSHGLRRHAAVESVRGSFEEAAAAITRATGVTVGKRQVEELARRAAADVEAFYAARRPGPAPDDEVLVLTCADYLTAKKPCLDYATALAGGWPIATGVIEGACRHLVKDRMDITGARWGLDGAEAILKLRALTSNGDFDQYWGLPPAARTQESAPGSLLSRPHPRRLGHDTRSRFHFLRPVR